MGTFRRGASKHGHMQKKQKEPKVVLVKRVNKDLDEDMEDMEGSNKRRAVCGSDELVEAIDQPCRQQ